MTIGAVLIIALLTLAAPGVAKHRPRAKSDARVTDHENLLLLATMLQPDQQAVTSLVAPSPPPPRQTPPPPAWFASILDQPGSAAAGQWAQTLAASYAFAGRPQDIGSLWAQSTADSYAQTIASGGPGGATAAAASIAAALRLGGDAQAANALAIGAGLAASGNRAQALAEAVAAVLAAHGCSFVREALLQAQAFAQAAGMSTPFAAATAQAVPLAQCLEGAADAADATAKAMAGSIGGVDQHVVLKVSGGRAGTISKCMTSQRILNCQVQQWLPAFEKLTYRTTLIVLPIDLVRYLVADGVFVPEASAALPTRVKPVGELDSDDYQDWSDGELQEEGSDAATDSDISRFTETLSQVDAAIQELGGHVTPKLNWSCPKDAVWISTGSTHRCSNAEEVLLLLKASDRVAHDIGLALGACCEPSSSHQPTDLMQHQPLAVTLALRKWHSLRPGREFRCFVRGHDLTAVSQREVSQHFPGLSEESAGIAEVLLEFFEEHLEQRFPDPDYTFDVYVTSASRVRLIDFNPIGGTTNPLLFTWEELGYTAESSVLESTAAELLDGNGCALAGPSGPMQQNPAAAVPGIRVAEAEPRNGSTPAHELAPQTVSDAIWESAARPNGWDQPRAGDGGARGVEIDFRVVTEPNRVQPNLPTFGVPYDLVDGSTGSAYEELLSHLQGSQNGPSP